MQVLVEACCAGLSCGLSFSSLGILPKQQKIKFRRRSVEFETQIRSLIASRKYWPHGRRVDIKTNGILHVTLSKRGVRDDAPIEVTGDTELDIRPYRLLHSEPESLFVSGDDNNCDNDATVASVHWRLPNSQLENLWDTLVFEEDIKCKILDYAEAMLLLSQSNVDPAIVPVNRLILLHGVPGTGKTTLCKAVAQRLAIRLQHTFCRSVFVVVNSHSLFSKWFSESGKLIQRMFDQVNQLLLDDKMLVVVLVDEVESIGMCRESALARNEPSDSVRAVNALLTQLDAIARHRNALVLATSNLLNSVDKALLDRADLLVHVPLPGRTVVQRLLREALEHLKEKGLLVESTGGECGESDALTDERMRTIVDGKLKDISCKCVGLSGRAVRRLPVRAFAAVPQKPVDVREYLQALEDVVSNDPNCNGVKSIGVNGQCQ